MALRHYYFGLENVALTAPQKQTIVDALKAMGQNDDLIPARRCHWRVRNDGEALIFEAMFEEDNLTVLAFRQRLATLFGVALANITAATSSNAYGTLATFSYQATPRLRIQLFGGPTASRAESRDAALAYLQANAAAWDLA